jgi:short-subunit dehydrogenase
MGPGAFGQAKEVVLLGLAESLRGEVIERGVKVTEVVIASTVRSGMSAGRDVPKIEPEDFAETVLAVASFAPTVAISQIVVGQLNPQ